jgi:cell volume regulation protein A
MRLAEKVMVGWVGLRGAAPIILATFPLLAGVPEAHVFFNLVFFIVLTSVVLQGTSIPFVARWLRVEIPLSERASQRPLDCLPLDDISSNLVEMRIPPDSTLVGKRIVDLGLPSNLLIVLITRQGGAIVPSGSSVLEADDRLLVLGSPTALYELSLLIGIPEGQAVATT